MKEFPNKIISFLITYLIKKHTILISIKLMISKINIIIKKQNNN